MPCPPPRRPRLPHQPVALTPAPRARAQARARNPGIKLSGWRGARRLDRQRQLLVHRHDQLPGRPESAAPLLRGRGLPVLAQEDFQSYLDLSEPVKAMGLDAVYEIIQPPGMVRLNRDNLVVICGHRLSADPARHCGQPYSGLRAPRTTRSARETDQKLVPVACPIGTLERRADAAALAGQGRSRNAQECSH